MADFQVYSSTLSKQCRVGKRKKSNADDNIKFVKLRAEWIKRKSNKDWSKRQKSIIDSLYKSNRKLKPKRAKA